MTLKQVLDSLQRLKPHTYDRADLLAWLDCVEQRIWHEVIQTHENPEGLAFAGYGADTPDTTALLAPAPYDELYLFYLMTQVDLHNLEYDKYNNSGALFNAAYQDFANYWNRARKPLGADTFHL